MLIKEKTPQKLSDLEVYIALIKGYCVTLILFLPGAFRLGGMIGSPMLLVASAIVTTICVAKLVHVGQFLNTHCYSLVMEQAFGTTGRIVLDIMIALTQFSFSISQMAFLTTSLKTTVDSTFMVNSHKEIYAVMLVFVMTPVAWVRNFAKFSFTYFLGNVLVLFVVIILIAQSSR